VVLRFFKKDPQEKEVNVHSIHLENALIIDISPEMKLSFLEENEPFGHMESVSFSYSGIRWVDEIHSREMFNLCMKSGYSRHAPLPRQGISDYPNQTYRASYQNSGSTEELNLVMEKCQARVPGSVALT